MNRPKFFLSSTIYDFKDLRSSIKFYLEELGYIIFASEFNDFPKPLDMHSYAACLETLVQSDYFILLIGSRVGGWYNRAEKLSITRQEYREAYKLHKQGKLKIITLVRSEVWQFREQRKELEKYLKNSSLTESEVEKITTSPSKFATDANVIIDFIEEISRNSETSRAVKDQAEFPTANWIHTFSTFRDITDVIRTETFSGVPIEKLAFKRLLIRELTDILKSTLVKFGKNKVYSPLNSIFRFREEHSINLDSRNHQKTEVITKRWNTLSTLAISLMGTHLQPQILERAVESPFFYSLFPKKTDLGNNQYTKPSTNSKKKSAYWVELIVVKLLLLFLRILLELGSIILRAFM